MYQSALTNPENQDLEFNQDAGSDSFVPRSAFSKHARAWVVAVVLLAVTGIAAWTKLSSRSGSSSHASLVAAFMVNTKGKVPIREPIRALSAWPENTTSYDDPAYRALMLQGCGEICDTSILGTRSKFFNETRKRVDCMGLYRNRHNDAPAPVWPSPSSIPVNLSNDYTLNGAAWTRNWYIEERYSGTAGLEPVWTEAQIEQLKGMALQDTLPGNYGWPVTDMIWKVINKHADRLKGKHAFVIGSETPWLEAMLLAVGARHVTTIEYGKIVSQHPSVSTMTPAQVTEQFLKSNGAEPSFDVAVTFSSLEHSGLGRYGDTLNPWADLQAVAKAWCITKSGGSMFLGLPASVDDEVCWNAHRSYGLHRWPHLMANWKQIDEPDGGMWRENHSDVVAAQSSQPCQYFQPMLTFERMDAPARGTVI